MTWQVGPDGTVVPRAEKESGRRTIAPEDVGLVAERLSREVRQALGHVSAHGIAAAWPRPGRPTKAARAAGRPRLKDLGLTKQQVSRWRELGGIPEAEFNRRMDTLKRISHEGLVGRSRPRGARPSG